MDLQIRTETPHEHLISLSPTSPCYFSLSPIFRYSKGAARKCTQQLGNLQLSSKLNSRNIKQIFNYIQLQELQCTLILGVLVTDPRSSHPCRCNASESTLKFLLSKTQTSPCSREQTRASSSTGKNGPYCKHQHHPSLVLASLPGYPYDFINVYAFRVGTQG